MDNFLTKEKAMIITEPFYNLFRAGKRDWDVGFDSMADDWKAYYTNTEFRNKTETRNFLKGFFDLIPDINVEIKHVLVDEDFAIFRTELSGTPKGDWVVPYTGRSFHVMDLDIHRIKDGKLIELYHVEDWFLGVNQLTGKAK